jgi:hypothetical protein
MLESKVVSRASLIRVSTAIIQCDSSEAGWPEWWISY